MKRRHRGPTQRRDPAILQVAVDLELRDVSDLYGLSVSTLQGYIRRQGMPHFRHRGKITVPRREFEAWRERFRAGATDRLVSEVLADLAPKPLADASKRLRLVRKSD
jgi:hypothetical protein